MDWILRRLASDLGVSPAQPGEDLTPHLRFERPWPPSVTLLVAAAAIGFIIWLYLRETSAPPWYRMMLAGIRSVLVLLALFFLAEAVLMVERTGLPTFVVLVDDSASMQRSDLYGDVKEGAAVAKLAAASGAEGGLSEKPTRLAAATGLLARDQAKLLRELQKQHQLRIDLVSTTTRKLADITKPEDIEPALKALRSAQASGSQSLLGNGVRQVLNELRGAPPTAILVLTDGQTTDGETLPEAAALAERKGVPLFTVGLGDPNPPRDLVLTDLLVDDVAFLDDVVRFEAKLTGRGFAGRPVQIRLLELPEGQSDPARAEVVATKQETAPDDGQTRRVELSHRPKKPGKLTYFVDVVALPQEERSDNNRLSRVVNVREDALRVLLVDGYPRYEYRYLKSFLERRPETVELRVVLLSADPEYSAQDEFALPTFPSAREGDQGLFRYDVVILGDIDPSFLSATQMQNLADFVTQQGGGLIFVAGPFFNPLTFKGTPLEPLLPVQLDQARDPTTVGQGLDAFRMSLTLEGRTSPIFRFGDDEASSLEIWNSLPTQYWYFEAPRKQPAAFVLAEHPTAQGADGKLPLVLYQFVGQGKTLFQAIDDTWRWRLGVGDRFFGRYWIQAIRFMARSKIQDQQLAELTTDRRSYQQGQPVLVRARFPNPAVNPPAKDVTVELDRKDHAARRLALTPAGNDGRTFETVVSQPVEGDYELRLVPFPGLSGELPRAAFQVLPPARETERVQMARNELAQAAKTSGGQFFTPTTVDGLAAALPRPQKVPLETDPPVPLWNDWRLFALFVGLLTTEWVLRKRKQMV